MPAQSLRLVDLLGSVFVVDDAAQDSTPQPFWRHSLNGGRYRYRRRWRQVGRLLSKAVRSRTNRP